MTCDFVLALRSGFMRFRDAGDFRGGMKWIVALPAPRTREIMMMLVPAQRCLRFVLVLLGQVS